MRTLYIWSGCLDSKILSLSKLYHSTSLQGKSNNFLRLPLFKPTRYKSETIAPPPTPATLVIVLTCQRARTATAWSQDICRLYDYVNPSKRLWCFQTEFLVNYGNIMCIHSAQTVNLQWEPIDESPMHRHSHSIKLAPCTDFMNA